MIVWLNNAPSKLEVSLKIILNDKVCSFKSRSFWNVPTNGYLTKVLIQNCSFKHEEFSFSSQIKAFSDLQFEQLNLMPLAQKYSVKKLLMFGFFHEEKLTFQIRSNY